MTDKEIIEEINEAGDSSGTTPESQPASDEAEVNTTITSEADVDVRKELEQVTERLQRQAAEFQNYRRRTEQEKSQMVVFGKSMVISQLLDVFDDFYRSIEATKQIEDSSEGITPFESLKSGVELAYSKLMDELKKMDVSPIEAIGHPFNEEFHEAVMQQPVADDEEVGIVLTEVQRGYQMGDRVLRHSKVIVSASNPAKNV